MPYRLKKGVEAFTVMDGPFEGRSFKPGVAYTEIPPQEAKKFEEIREEAKTEAEAQKAKPGSKRTASEATPAKEVEQ